MSEAILVALIAATPPTLMALAALIVGLGNRRKSEELHLLINSRLSELLASSTAAARSEGHEAGVAAEQSRTRGAET